MSHPNFARHETFHPRYGWLKKGVDLIANNPSAFTNKDVHMELGVGKNMAHAIRYWCEAFGLINSTKNSLKQTVFALTPTALELITGATALDPYLENTATLWWLHYNLIKTQKATTWNFAINHFGRPSFTAEQFLGDLKRFVQAQYPDQKVAESSLVKDVNLFLRMYTYDEKAPFHEDSIDSPFVELGLLSKRGETYNFVTGAKPSLPDAIIAAACLDFATTRPTQGISGAKSISFTELMNADGSPVKAFRLTENTLYDALEDVCEEFAVLFISDTAGVKQLAWKIDPQHLVQKILKGYYRYALY